MTSQTPAEQPEQPNNSLDTDSARNARINVAVRCSLTAQSIELMTLLFESVLQITEFYPLPYLDKIIIVDRADVIATVDELVRSMQGSTIPYTGDPNATSKDGAALPCVVDGRLTCFVVLAGELFANMTPNSYRDPQTVSTVLEELLHVWQYGQTWQRTGDIYLVNADEPCEDYLYSKMKTAFDEYIVNRHKVAWLSEVPLIDFGSGLTTVSMAYGGGLTETVTEGEKRLRKCVFDVAEGRMDIVEGWPSTCEWLYRGVLEPLSRNAAYLDSYAESVSSQHEPDTVFFRRVICNYWLRIHEQLKRALMNPVETEDAIRLSMIELRDFMSLIGITYRKTEDGGCYVHFNSTPFMIIDADLQRTALREKYTG